ncbi:MAG: response regulator transcription factor [Clostridiales bacterium]|nr:response regulator transcription factor [Clostridiales bacterium]
MIKVAIVDDDALYAKALEEHIEKYSIEFNIEFDVTWFQSGLEMMFDYKPVYDIILLDILMPKMDGMELAKLIRQTDVKSKILFVTNTPHFAVQGYEVDAYDYLVKPVTYDLFKIKFRSVLDALQTQTVSLVIQHQDEEFHLDAENIIYIEVRDHWLSIQTIDKTYEMLGSLKEMGELLSDSSFVRCNKSTLINLLHVQRIKSDMISMRDNHTISASRNQKKHVQAAFVEYYSKQKW